MFRPHILVLLTLLFGNAKAGSPELFYKHTCFVSGTSLVGETASCSISNIVGESHVDTIVKYGVLTGASVAYAETNIAGAHAIFGFRDTINILPTDSGLLGKEGLWEFKVSGIALEAIQLAADPGYVLYTSLTSRSWLNIETSSPISSEVTLYNSTWTRGWTEDIGYGGILVTTEHSLVASGKATANADGTYLNIGVPFIFGRPLELQVSITLDAGVQRGSSRAAAEDFIWQGTTAVSYSTTPVEVDITSASGTDWKASAGPLPIPEPNSAILLALGLVIVFLRREMSRKDAPVGG